MMKSLPLVSIILPTFNGSRFLDQAIQSCLEQTYQNWEMIIVDDASTDETPEIIARFAYLDTRIRSIRHENNRNLPGALNSGFALAGGEYFTWTSDDNCYLPQALGEMVNVLDSQPGTDIVYCDYSIIDESGAHIAHKSVETIDKLHQYNCIGACFLCRKIVYEKLERYTDELFLAEDYDFWMRALNHFNFYPLHKTLYHYRAHDNSLSRQKTEKITKATERAFKKNYPHIHGLGCDKQAEGWLYLAQKALAYNNFKLARKYLIYSITSSPGFAYRNNFDLLIARQIEQQKDSQLQALLSSRSWKITYPLRWLGNLLSYLRLSNKN